MQKYEKKIIYGHMKVQEKKEKKWGQMKVPRY
jgi:hypothetical protein